jgi:hypothetical protein
MTTPQRTDYLPAEVYERHVNDALRRGDKTFGDPHKISAVWDPNYDRFVANVAYELRHYVVYRSDGGQYARGLVRQSGEINAIFHELRKSAPAKGVKIGLLATFWRRQNPNPANRWALIVRFSATGIIALEPEAISASQDVSFHSEKNFVELLLREADPVAQNIQRQIQIRASVCAAWLASPPTLATLVAWTFFSINRSTSISISTSRHQMSSARR